MKISLDIVSTYLTTLQKDLARGNATEHTHRTALKILIEELYPEIIATNEPKRIKSGAPDYVLEKGETPIGYIEAKDVGVSLDKTEKTEQLGRYFEGLGNLILTDYLEFRWYVEGEHRQTVKLASFNNNQVTLDNNALEGFELLLSGFMEATVPTISSPQALAKKMASLAKQIKYSIIKAFDSEDLTDDEPDPLHDQYDAFKEILLKDLTEQEFADMYAQTITYGLFAARTSPTFEPPFTRYKASHDIPKTNPFLQEMFRQMAGPDLPVSLDWIVDDLVNLLAHADIDSILSDFGKRTRTEDPVVHFYETFLAAYDSKMREARGVYYTPEPVVSYIVRSVDHILKTDFGLGDGLADTSKVKVKESEAKTLDERGRKKSYVRKYKDVHKVQILDPATGTGTFLHGVVDQIHETVSQNYGDGAWSQYVGEHLLPRLHGFELLMAPYTVAHMKIGLQLQELGYDFSGRERLGIYLTNALEEAQEFPSLPLFGQLIARESQDAGQVKGDSPVMIVLGNPPYSGVSSNNGAWISDLLKGKDVKSRNSKGKPDAYDVVENYFEIDGKPLGERNPKYLNDDYVKFIRFSQWRIEQTGYGVLAFVTNNGYLDNPTFRGMRESLFKTFDKIYIFDLHGSAKKQETTLEGLNDKNVFDIQQGVSVGIFIKTTSNSTKTKVYRADLLGKRTEKYNYLWEENISTTDWTELNPQAPWYLFAPLDESLIPELDECWQTSQIWLQTTSGIKTHRDHFVVSFEEEELMRRINDFRNLEISDSEISGTYRLKDTSSWKLNDSRKHLASLENADSHLIQYTYRPFDNRHYYHHEYVVDRPRSEVMNNVVNMKNFVLGLGRQGLAVNDDSWSLVTISKKPIDTNVYRRGGVNVFPLYLYSDLTNLFDQSTDGTNGRKPNLNPEFIEDVSKRIKLVFIEDGQGDLEENFGPEDVFYYIYAIFHSPNYRERYAEFLNIDFPRLPLTSNLALFRSMVALGQELVQHHLLEQTKSIGVRFEGEGDNVVDKLSFKLEDESNLGRVYINKTQFFSGVPSEVYEFYVGGYQVLNKWLKDRKGRELSFDDLKHYQNIVGSLSETIRLMTEIDVTIEVNGGFPIT